MPRFQATSGAALLGAAHWPLHNFPPRAAPPALVGRRLFLAAEPANYAKSDHRLEIIELHSFSGESPMLRCTALSTAVQVVSRSSTASLNSARCRRLGLFAAAALTLGVILTAESASAAQYYWFGDDNNFWNQIVGPGGTNWSSSPDFNNGTGGLTALPSSTSDVFFVLSGAGNLNTELGASFSINSLTFTPDATSPVQINDTPGTHALTIGTGGITDNGPSTYFDCP
jgi:hypothetical protein